jgi:hypothetical protein
MSVDKCLLTLWGLAATVGIVNNHNNNNNNNNNNKIRVYLTANGLSPDGSGYNACT